MAAGFLFLAHAHQRVAQIEQRFGEPRVFLERLLIKLRGILGLPALLADEAGVVEELG